ncbi:YSIRK-type signal peptide-containing protein, partial [Staphylococcus intermedius]
MKNNKYSIRKFTYGVASILIGSTLIFGMSNEAHAKSNSLVKEDTTPVEDKNEVKEDTTPVEDKNEVKEDTTPVEDKNEVKEDTTPVED